MFKDKYINVYSSLFAILAGLLLGLVIMMFTNIGQAFPAFITILTGGFRDISKVLFFATPIILTGLSVGFAFRTGLFNIGASGQLMVGAFVAVFIGVRWTFLPDSIHWLVALIAGGLAGALWALVPGILKAYRNVHEVVATIMMNYIGLYLVTYLVRVTVYNPDRNESLSVAPEAAIPKFGLDKIFGANAQVNGGFLIAVLAVIIIYIILERTTFGFQLKAVGFSRESSRYAGINEKRGIVASMAISGLLAGLAGGTIYLATQGRHLEVVEVLVQEGFTGISVALIGLSSPIGILLAGIFMAYITVGGYFMQLYDFVPEIIDIIISLIIYFSALILLFKDFILKYYKRRLTRIDALSEEEGDL